MKVSTAQEWVDAATACGADPHIVPGSFDRHGREIKPGSRGLATKTVDSGLGEASRQVPQRNGRGGFHHPRKHGAGPPPAQMLAWALRDGIRENSNDDHAKG